MGSSEHSDSIENLKSNKRGWPAAQGVRLGDEVKLPSPEGLLDGEVIGVAEALSHGTPTVYATVELKSQNNVRPEIEVGQLNEIKKEVKLMDFILNEFRAVVMPSEGEFQIIIARLRDTIEKLNTGKQKPTGEEERIVFQLRIVMDKSDHCLRLIKSESGYYTMEVDEWGKYDKK